MIEESMQSQHFSFHVCRQKHEYYNIKNIVYFNIFPALAMWNVSVSPIRVNVYCGTFSLKLNLSSKIVFKKAKIVFKKAKTEFTFENIF